MPHGSARRRLPWPLVALLAGACGAADRERDPAPAATAAASAWVPLELQRNLIFAAGRVEGADVSILVDSGARRTIVSRALAEELALEPVAETSTWGLGGAVEAAWLPEVKVGLGGWTLVEAEALTLDLSRLWALAGRRWDAVVGHAIFARFVVDLDLPNRRLRLHEPEAYEHGTYGRGAGSTVPLRVAERAGGAPRLAGQPRRARRLGRGRPHPLGRRAGRRGRRAGGAPPLELAPGGDRRAAGDGLRGGAHAGARRVLLSGLPRTL